MFESCFNVKRSEILSDRVTELSRTSSTKLHGVCNYDQEHKCNDWDTEFHNANTKNILQVSIVGPE